MTIPDTLTPDQEDILTTLRALAGLVVQALHRTMAGAVEEEDASSVPEQASADLTFWRDVLLQQTRRLLPTLSPTAGPQESRLFAEELVRVVYLADQEARHHHGCEPLSCDHPVHGCR